MTDEVERSKLTVKADLARRKISVDSHGDSFSVGPANDDPNSFSFLIKEDGIWFRSREWTQERLVKLVDPGKEEALKEAMVSWLAEGDFGDR